MPENPPASLPLPKWCFVLLGALTFHLYLVIYGIVYNAMVVIFKVVGEVWYPPEWVGQAIINSFICVTICLWPIYLVWIVRSKRLTRREKVASLLMVTVMNWFGMPIFFVFMVRRYLGLEGRMGPKDEKALDRFLQRHGIERQYLSPGQAKVMLAYCRKDRLERWLAVAMFVAGAILLYTVVVTFRKLGQPFIADDVDLHRIFGQPFFNQIIMGIGVMAGVLGAASVAIMIEALAQFWGNWHREALIELLQAAENEPPVKPSA
jgi:hypothetical protein